MKRTTKKKEDIIIEKSGSWWVFWIWFFIFWPIAILYWLFKIKKVKKYK